MTTGWLKTYGEPLGVVHLACTEECLKGVVCWEDEADQVDQELSSDVEEDQEEV